MISSPEPVVEFFAPAPAVFYSTTPVLEYIAPVVGYLAPAPAVFPAPEPVVESIAPAPAVVSATPAVEYIAPAPAVILAPTPVVEFFAPVPAVFHAPVSPLSPDASDTSSHEDEYTSSWVSLPVPIKSFTQVESAEPLNLASVTPTVFHGRELPAGRRDGLVGHATATFSAAFFVTSVCLLVEMFARPCQHLHKEQASWWRRFGSWQPEGRARVRVARVLERVLGLRWL